MAEFTPNYELKKPGDDDFYDVKDFNDNADIIDQALKAHDDALATKETIAGAQAKAEAAAGAVQAELDAHLADNAVHINYMYRGKRYTITNPYAKGGNLSLKGQLHCHTTESDGEHTPAEMMERYKELGFDFATITDHDVVTADPGVEGITWIGSGVEESAAGMHITAYDVESQTNATHRQQVIDYHFNRGSMTSIAHPNLPATYHSGEDLAKLLNYNFIEILNSHTVAEDKWDAILSYNRRIFGIAVDDTHLKTSENRGWVVVFANENTKEAILESLRDGNFYASNGNDIKITVDGNVITATSTTNSLFTFIGEGGKTLQTNDNTVTASYTIQGYEKYVRVRSVRKSDSKIAWSQPVFIDFVGGDQDELISNSVSFTTDFATNATKTYYIDEVNGNDSNDGTTELTAFKTWEKVNSLLPLYIQHTITVRIIGNLAEKILLRSKILRSKLLIRGNTDNPSNHIINDIELRGNASEDYDNLTISHLTINGTLKSTCNNGLRIVNCAPRGTTVAGGIQAVNSLVWVENCDFGENVCSRAIVADRLSHVVSYNNVGSCTEYGLRALGCSVIGKNGTQPTGLISDESVATGGVIR